MAACYFIRNIVYHASGGATFMICRLSVMVLSPIGPPS